MILSAVGCSGCQGRIPTDQQARQKARAAGYRSLSVMVFGDQVSGRKFVERTHQSADDMVFDAGAAPVTVGTYGGSDGTCWLLLKEGKVVWQGPPDLKVLQSVLGSATT